MLREPQPADSHASVEIEETDRNTRIITVEPKEPGFFVSRRRWETHYPVELIERVLRIKGAASLCDEIARDESPQYVEHDFRWDILSFEAPEAFVGKRILDFGSGAGASTMVLARLFPESRIEGVELVSDYVELAQERAKFYGTDDRIRFHLSPNGSSLPTNIGQFDYIFFSAVFEHLLPAERRTVLPLLWTHLKPGGTMFLDQTPYRWFPIEQHTTGIPFLNYAPDTIAIRLARRFSRRVRSNETWEELLRRGIRGGSVREIMAILSKDGRRAELRNPGREGVRDAIDLWYRLSGETRWPIVKSLMRHAFKVIRSLTGVTMVPTLSLAIQKSA